ATQQGEKKLADLICFSDAQHAAAVEACAKAIEAYDLGSSDLRVLFAATRLAFQAEPAKFSVKIDGMDTRGRLLEQMQNSTNNDLRADEEPVQNGPPSARSAFLKQQGNALLAILRRRAEETYPARSERGDDSPKGGRRDV